MVQTDEKQWDQKARETHATFLRRRGKKACPARLRDINEGDSEIEEVASRGSATPIR
ncbi:hypothetical protein ccbrp13_13930 [Ktedonobacteria bacterium brp13]|nr:hypothetical protein ccbrp13_13930 [Ktedonobacteria bacterium brp13]